MNDVGESVGLAILESPGWAPVRRGLRRRESTQLRVMLGRDLDHEFGPDGSPVDVDRLLRLWARFAQAVYDEDHASLRADLKLGAEADLPGWAEVVPRFFEFLLGAFPPADTVAGVRSRATFATFAAAETIVFWEHSVVAEEVAAIRDALGALASAMPGDSAEATACRGVVEVAVLLMTSLVHQLAVEAATAGCAVAAIGDGAAAARGALDEVQARAGRVAERARALLGGEEPRASELAADPRDARLGIHLLALTALILDEVGGTRPYFDLLASWVAPAALAFLDNLGERQRDSEVAAELRAAAERCRAFEDSEVGGWSVFASEARAQRVPLEVAAAHCADPALRTLEFGAVAVTYLYPFGLPVAATGTDVLPELMESLTAAATESRAPIVSLAGARVVIDDAPRSDGWLASTSVQERDYRAFRAVFPDHELMLTTTDGVTYADLDVDVCLSGMGNHYVRVRIGTATRIDGAPAADQSPWTPHDLEQAIRRGGEVGGPETVWFRARTPGSADSEEFPNLLGLAARIVEDLATAAHAFVSSPAAELDRDLAVARGFLARYSRILLVVSQAATLGRDGSRAAVVELADLRRALGVETALTAQRPLAQSPLEWVTFTRPEPEVRARRTLPGRIRQELVWCAGDVATIFGPTAPHWQLLVTRADAEFASSLIGVYWRRQQWLRRVVDEAGELLAARGATIEELEATSTRLSDAIRHVQLLVDRANEYTLAKGQQGREVTQHLMALNGVSELENSLDATVQAAIGTEGFLRERLGALHAAQEERREREREARAEAALRRRQRPLEVLVAVLAVLSLIDLFAWTNQTWGVAEHRGLWVAEALVVLAAGGVVWWLSRRSSK